MSQSPAMAKTDKTLCLHRERGWTKDAKGRLLHPWMVCAKCGSTDESLWYPSPELQAVFDTLTAEDLVRFAHQGDEDDDEDGDD